MEVRAMPEPGMWGKKKTPKAAHFCSQQQGGSVMGTHGELTVQPT